MLTDMDISRRAHLKDIAALGAEFGLLPDEMQLFGKTKAKVDLRAQQRDRKSVV